ncbi:MAG: FHA domain-containing protein [Propionibacteriaceae bacterium]|jgi:hypothetical protein|nr:FHA domain-containing protein [Propionibacteriaceae bacterium]
MADQVNDAANAQSRNFSHAGLGGWRVTYQPGSWLVLSGPSSLVMLDAQPGQASEFVNDLWEDVVGAASVAALVSKLAARGLDRIADLVVLFIENGVMRTLVRGGVRVLDADTGASLVEGTGVITWREAQIPTGRVRVDVGQTGGGLELPLVVGAAQCSGLLVDLDDLPPVAVEEQPVAVAQPDDGAHGDQWHPVAGDVQGAAELGVDHHRDWGGPVNQEEQAEEGQGPAAETTGPVGTVQPAGSSVSTMKFDVLADTSDDQDDRPASTSAASPTGPYEPQPAQGEQDEPADNAAMNWMAQQPRDDSFMYEKTEVLGSGPGPLGGPGQPSPSSYQQGPAADEAAAQQYAADEAAAQQYAADEAAAQQQPGNDSPPAWDGTPWTPADGYGPGPSAGYGPGAPQEQYVPAERTLGQEAVGAPGDQGSGGPQEQYAPAERTLGQEAVGSSSPSRGDWSPQAQPRAFAQVVTISGLSQPLNGPLLIGRSPQLPEGMTAETLRVPSPHHDISRSHVYLEPQDGQILVADMNSTNGTIIYMPNANPLRLEDGQSILVPVGTTLDLGDGEQVNLSVPLS